MKPLEHEDIFDPIESDSFGAPARRVTALPMVPNTFKYLRSKEDPSQIWAYSEHLARRSDLVEGYNGPLPGKMSEARLRLEQQLRMADTPELRQAAIDAINEYNERLRAEAYLARESAVKAAKEAGAPPPPKV